MKRTVIVGCAAVAAAAWIQPLAVAQNEEGKSQSALPTQAKDTAPERLDVGERRELPALDPSGSEPTSMPEYTPDWSVIEDVQEKLIQRGYRPGMVNGVVGPLTREAIVEFQKNNDMPVTGEINRALLRKLGL